MRFHEIADIHPISDEHPGVVISVHPSLWSQLRRFIEASPNDYCVADKIEPASDNWIIHVGCASEAARSRFDSAWG